MLDVENLLQLDEPDFTFGEDGDLIELTPGQSVPATPVVARGAPMHSDTGASARVRQEHEEGQQGGAQVSFAVVPHWIYTICLLVRSCPLLYLCSSLTMAIHTPSLGAQMLTK
jgi:hypothetical protein